VSKSDEKTLRAQLKAASEAGQPSSDLPVGSVYLYTLGCAFLGAPEEDEGVTSVLFELFERQAELEGVDADEAFDALGLIEAAP